MFRNEQYYRWQWQLEALWLGHTLFLYNSHTTPSLCTTFHCSLGRKIMKT